MLNYRFLFHPFYCASLLEESGMPLTVDLCHQLCILLGMVRPSGPLTGTSKEIILSPTQRMGDLTIHYPYWTLKVKELSFHLVNRYKELPLVNRYIAVPKKTGRSLFGQAGWVVTCGKRETRPHLPAPQLGAFALVVAVVGFQQA